MTTEVDDDGDNSNNIGSVRSEIPHVLVKNCSTQFVFYFACLNYHNLKHRKIRIKLVGKILNQIIP